MRINSRTIQSLFFFLLYGIVATPSLSAAQQQHDQEDDKLKMTARYHIESGTNSGFLIVKFVIPEGSHIYSLTQKSPLSPSKLTVKNNKQFNVDKQFQSDKKPLVIENDPLFNTRVEKHKGTIQFFVPIKVDTSVDLKKLRPEIQFSGQMCSEEGFCKLINAKKFHADFAGFFQREAKNVLPSLKQK